MRIMRSLNRDGWMKRPQTKWRVPAWRPEAACVEFVATFEGRVCYNTRIDATGSKKDMIELARRKTIDLDNCQTHWFECKTMDAVSVEKKTEAKKIAGLGMAAGNRPPAPMAGTIYHKSAVAGDNACDRPVGGRTDI